MIPMESIMPYFPIEMRESTSFRKYMLKEYIQLSILDFISSTPYIKKIVFIGGTCLRLVKRIDRFSEDLDFDCKDLSKEEFMEMTDSILHFLIRTGLRVEVRDRENRKLTAFRRNIHFPELLFDLGLSGHKEERFLIKIESEDQNISYNPELVNIKGCGFYFPFPVPPDGILCSMKIAAMLSRSKGRDFYDSMFLLGLTEPDYTFLAAKHNIHNLKELQQSMNEILETVDMNQKKRDFEHLLFHHRSSERILSIREFMDDLR